MEQIVVQPKIDSCGCPFTVKRPCPGVGENVENTGGELVDSGRNSSLFAGSDAWSLDEISDPPVKFASGVMPLRERRGRCADWSRLSHRRRDRRRAGTVPGVAMMLMGENSHAVAGRVEPEMEEIKKILPARDD